MNTLEPTQSRSQDIANAITFGSLILVGGFALVGFGVCWYIDTLFHQALPWVH